MGYNTSMIIMNDALREIANDPRFGYKVARAASEVGLMYNGKGVDVPSGGHVNAATVIETHHADATSVVAFGQNEGVHLATVWPCGEGDYKVRVLKALANELGYNVHRKAQR